MIYFIADPHFFHDAAPAFPTRNFESLEDMHEDIITKWNSSISQDDTVYVLGDYCFGRDYKRMVRLTESLHGRKILIKGNHDLLTSKQYCSPSCFTKYYDVPIIINNNIILSHEPVTALSGDGLLNIHGHTHGAAFSGRTGKHICVSCDCTNMAPVSINEIYRRMEVRLP